MRAVSTPAVPQHCPTPRELDDLELLASGALAPITGFDQPKSPITLDLPASLREATTLELVDPEGLPLARIDRANDGSWDVAPLTHAQYGPFRRLYLTPDAVRAAYAGRTFVPVTGPITDTQLSRLRGLGPICFLALVGHGTPDLSPVALLRATLAVCDLLPDAVVIAVPLASHGDADADHALGVQVTRTYAGVDPVVALVHGGEPLPALQEIIEHDQPPRDRQGLVLFFTGLSGSGKSTLARALMDRLLERGERTVTSLDGDVVRRNLSAGLTFSKGDRETNIRRIGWVAAEIARHGGIAVCSPIAPFDETRQQVRAMVDDAGGAFFLVHVATPLEECERRDRKGLYAKARRGEIPEFTGVSSPYEVPADADARVDTTGRTIEDALDDVIVALADAGYVDLTPSVVEPGEAEEKGEARVETTTTTRRPLDVLFVCTANICRSPYMELTARRLYNGDAVRFSSAGTHGFVDEPMNPPMVEVLARRGGSAEGFRSRRLTRELVDGADLVVTAESAHRTFILEEHPAAFRKVFTLGQLAAAIESAGPVERDELLAQIGSRRGPADPALDVADPYRRGSAAAEAAATHIDTLLRVVVPALAGSERIA